MKRALFSAALAAAVLFTAAAWDNHTQMTYLALGAEPWAGRLVRAENFDAFVLAEQARLAPLLADLEKEFAHAVPEYPARPAALAFTGGYRSDDGGVAAREAFIAAIRVNPAVPFPLYVALRADGPRPKRPDLPVAKADIFDFHVPNAPFQALASGEDVTVLEVVSTASDEPDYGMDIGLFADNKGPVSNVYGFGVQPFGNPDLSYGSQAPFHMAFAHENPIIHMAAPFTRTALADYRFRLYTGLSRFAFAEGHEYWGWRFAGWAMHYLQDSTQPYHADMIPGMNAAQILWLYATGGQAARDGALMLLSNRHLLLEAYQYGVMAAYKGDDSASPIYAALKGGAIGGKTTPALPPIREGYLFDVASWNAYGRGMAVDRMVVATFPAKWTSDPKLDFGTLGDVDLHGELVKSDPARARAFEAAIAPCLADFGSATRAFAEYVRDPAAVAGPRKAPFDPRGAELVGVPLLVVAAIVTLALPVRKKKLRKS
jgi:hypothetical protein